MNLSQKWAEIIMSPWARTFFWGLILTIAGIMLYYDGLNAMDAIQRQAAANCKCGVNISQTIANITWRG